MIIDNQNKIRYFFKAAHSGYYDEEYIRERNANLIEWIKRLQNNAKDEIISKEEDNNLKNKIIDYWNENCL